MRKYLIIIALLAIVEISLTLYLTEWRKIFWDYVSAKDYYNFFKYLGIFTIVALSLCGTIAYAAYLSTLAAIKWRETLTARAELLKDKEIENVNQRIQEDCLTYPTLVITLGISIVKSIIYIAVFALVLSWQFTWLYLLLIASYATISTFIAKKIGNPLLGLNYKLQQVEATYRNKINKENFAECIYVQSSLARKLKHLQYFQSFYSQLGVIIPLLILAPAYFTSAMTLGSLMQANSLMSTISENLSFGINNFDVFNRLLSCRRRLIELGVL